MVVGSWERARSEEQKNERIAEIVQAAARLYKNLDVDDINLAMIAKEANFTRSNIYKYFASKEEIFLELIKLDRVKWRKDLEKTFKGRSVDTDMFSREWMEVQLRHTRLTQLHTIMYTVLEKNASLDSLIALKKTYLEEAGYVLKLLVSLFDGLTEELAGDFLIAQAALSIGSYPYLTFNTRQKEAMIACGMKYDTEYFQEQYFYCTKALIESVLDRAKEASLQSVS